MADQEFPVRLRVVKALTVLLQGITIAQGYKHDLQAAVFRGRNKFGNAGGDEDEAGGDPLPMVSILEAPIAPEQLTAPEESAKAAGPWDLLIQGFCEDEKENPTDAAYLLSADVIKAIAVEKNRSSASRFSRGNATAFLGITNRKGAAVVVGVQIGAPVHRPPDETSSSAYFWLPITLNMAENLEDPYG